MRRLTTIFVVLGVAMFLIPQYGCTPCVDLDGDGYGSAASLACKHPQLDCDDGNPEVNPGKTEGPYGDETCSDGLDNNCNGLADSEEPQCISKGLVEEDFQRVGSGGFGDSANSYGWSMALFNGDLYVGSNRHHEWQLSQPFVWWMDTLGIPLGGVIPGPDDQTWGGQMWAEEMRGEIWRYRTASGLLEWKRVHQSDVFYGELPIIATPNYPPPPDPPIVGYYPESYGYRKMGTFDGHLYAIGVCTWWPNMPFGHILRSADGEHWEDVTGIIATRTNPRSLAVYQGKLFVGASIPGSAPAGGGEALVYASSDPKTEGWTEVSLPGFGNEDNAELPYLTVFDDHLYASTINYNTGFEVWKTDGTLDPDDPEGKRYVWTPVIKDGFGDTWNQWGMTMKGFGDYLYVGTAAGGGMVLKDGMPVGKRAFDVIRVDRDDNAELVVGAEYAVDPPQGWPEFRTPLSGWPAGFGNEFNVYVWTMEVHDGWLYLGTMDLLYENVVSFPRGMLQLPPDSPLLRILELWAMRDGGADLWKTKDGINWEPVTITGFGNPFNVGIRDMLSVGNVLYVTTGNGYTGYTRGGCEVLAAHE
jgi:hypothetical protein